MSSSLRISKSSVLSGNSKAYISGLILKSEGPTDSIKFVCIKYNIRF